ncbi:MAG TPA: hypothetical protein PLG99_00790 [Kaistiaceae bacterium]|nr:hypothetical protein [Kaistiaceae bacterium]
MSNRVKFTLCALAVFFAGFAAASSPAAAATLSLGERDVTFVAPAGICFLDAAAGAVDAAALASLAPLDSRYVVAAGFGTCDEVEAWRADPRRRVARWGAVFLDRRYVGDDRFRNIAPGADVQLLRALDGLGAGPGGLPALRSMFAAFDKTATAAPAGWSSHRGGVRLGAIEAVVTADDATAPVVFGRATTILGDALVEILMANAPAGDGAADSLSRDVLQLARAMKAGTAAPAPGPGEALTRWIAPPEPEKAQQTAAGSALVPAERAAVSVLVELEKSPTSVLVDPGRGTGGVLVAPERVPGSAFVDPAAPGISAAPAKTAVAPVVAPAAPAPDVPAIAPAPADALAEAAPPATVMPDFAAIPLRVDAVSASFGQAGEGAPPAFGEDEQMLDFATFELRPGEAARP